MCPCADNVWGLKPVAEAKALQLILDCGLWIVDWIGLFGAGSIVNLQSTI
jgi:hypothetical protein